MAKMNSTSAFALFPQGQNVTFTLAGAEEKSKGKIKGWNDEKQKFSVEKAEGGAVFLAADRLKKGQGRPPVSEEDKKAKAEKPKAQTPAKAAPKASAKDKDESSEIEANELSAEDFENIGNALETMIEMLDPETLTVSEMLEKLETIRGTLDEMHGGIMGHHAHMTQTSEDDEVEASDEAEPEEDEAEPEEEVKTKPKTSLLKKK